MGRNEVAVASAVDGALTGHLRIADQEFDSRLFVGTGKYPDNETMVEAIRASGTAMVTVAVRRVDLDRTQSEGILFHLDPEEFFLLPNTAGCYTAEDAIRYARLACAAGCNEWVKLEVIGHETTLVPDTQATHEAAEPLVAEGENEGVGGERMIPFSPAIVSEVDLEARVIRIDPPPGLLDV